MKVNILCFSITVFAGTKRSCETVNLKNLYSLFPIMTTQMTTRSAATTTRTFQMSRELLCVFWVIVSTMLCADGKKDS